MIVRRGENWCLLSRKTGRNLGCYPTREGAMRRERQIQFFKRRSSGLSGFGSPRGGAITPTPKMRELSVRYNAVQLRAQKYLDESLCRHVLANARKAAEYYGQMYAEAVYNPSQGNTRIAMDAQEELDRLYAKLEADCVPLQAPSRG